MHRRRIGIGLSVLCLIGAAVAPAAELLPANPATTASAAAPAGPDAARELTAAIDARIAAKWQATAPRPAPPADDSEFLRRVTLDLTGTIPSASEARDFLDDRSADKRARLVERLL